MAGLPRRSLTVAQTRLGRGFALFDLPAVFATVQFALVPLLALFRAGTLLFLVRSALFLAPVLSLLLFSFCNRINHAVCCTCII
jgi:hypothetical protein